MQIRIIETKEAKELIILGANNMDYSNDLLGNHNATTYNEETQEHEMKEDDFEYWDEYIDYHNSDTEEIRELAETYNIDESEINEAIQREMQLSSDLSEEHGITQEVLRAFKQEKKLYLIGKKWNEVSIGDREELFKSANLVDATTGIRPKESGECTIDFIGYPLSIRGEVVISEEKNTIIIEDESIIYNS